MLRKLAENLWVAEQPQKYMGLQVGTRMSVVRLSNQALVVISPIVLTEEIKGQLDAIGPVEHIIAPNLYHYFYASQCKETYPQATLWATKGLKGKQPALPIDKTLGEEGLLWKDLSKHYFDGFKTLSFDGVESLEEWVFFHADSRTLIVTDVAFHFDESFPLINQLSARVLGCYQQLGPSWFEKMAMKETTVLQSSLAAVLSWDFDRVVMAHGRVVERDGKAKLKAGYEGFLG